MSAISNDLRQLIDTANDQIFRIDVNGNVNEYNNKTGKITGSLQKEVLTYQLVSILSVPKLQQQVQDTMDNALQSIETFNYELEFSTKSNEFRYILNVTTCRDSENNIARVVVVAQDVKESKKNRRCHSQ